MGYKLIDILAVLLLGEVSPEVRGYERREAGFIIEGGDGQRWSREYYCTGDIWGQPGAAISQTNDSQ